MVQMAIPMMGQIGTIPMKIILMVSTIKIYTSSYLRKIDQKHPVNMCWSSVSKLTLGPW